MKHNKKFFFGKIDHNTQLHKFMPFHQLKDSCHTSIENQRKYLIYVISNVDLDSYPFHIVLPRIQEDTSIDIPCV